MNTDRVPPAPEAAAPLMTAQSSGESFHDQLRDSLRTAPWFAISIGFHALLFLVIANMSWSTRTEHVERAIEASAPEEPVDALPPIEEKIEPVKDDPPPVPVVDPVPTVTEEIQTELSSELVDMRPLAPFKGAGKNDVNGGGGGGGGGAGPPGGKLHGRGGIEISKHVAAALDWLARHQEKAGFWDCDDFGRHCSSPLNDGRGNALHDVGVTGLALLPFLGIGNTHRHGQYADTLKRGLGWLRRTQDREDGCFGSKNGQHFLYGHALATLAMVEAYHLSGDPLLKRHAQEGLHFISRARNPYKAWRYHAPPNGENDTSVTGWMLFALFAGRDAGLQIDDDAIDDGMAFLDEMTDPGTGRTGYRTRGSFPAREPDDQDGWPCEQSESMTAVACLCRVFDGQDPRESEPLRQGAELMLRKLPTWDESAGTIDFYYWYYGSYVMWQMGDRSWARWQRALLPSIVRNQRGGEGCERGSWDPQVDPWGDDGGRVYSTAINALSLQVYYRYDRLLGAR